MNDIPMIFPWTRDEIAKDVPQDSQRGRILRGGRLHRGTHLGSFRCLMQGQTARLKDIFVYILLYIAMENGAIEIQHSYGNLT